LVKKTSHPPQSKEPAPRKHEVHACDFPGLEKISIEDLTAEACRYISTLAHIFKSGQSLFQTTNPTAEDWAILLVVIHNEAIGRATVTKNIVEVTGRAFGTVRAALLRFEKLGYIESQQRIGRSELYVPTYKLKSTLNATGEIFENLQK
jgi:hypothetical protein